MSIEAAIVALLAASTRTTGLVAGRVQPKIIAQGTLLPAIAYHVVSNTREYTARGRVDLATARVQLNCIGETMGSAAAVRDALEGDLADLATALAEGPQIFAGVTVTAVFLEDDADLPDDWQPGIPGVTRYGKRVDLAIWHKE